MLDVNGSSFHLLADQADWSHAAGMTCTGSAYSLAGKQNWRLPSMPRSAAQANLAASQPLVVDEFSTIARMTQNGSGVESLDGTAWTPLKDLAGTKLAPRIGRFVAMSLGGARLALLASDGTSAYLELFDLRARWPLDSVANPSVPVTLDPAGTAVAVAADGPIFVVVQGGLAIFEGTPLPEMFAGSPGAVFAPVAANPNPLRRTALLGNRPGGAAMAMAADPGRVAILLDQGTEAQTLAVLDRATGLWSGAPIVATDGTPLPYMTDIALLPDSLVGLMAPNPSPADPCDVAVVTVVPGQGVTLAPYRYPTLNQFAPRFAAIPGPDVFYIGTAAAAAAVPAQSFPAPRRLVPLPYPAYVTTGALLAAVAGNDPDAAWHRLYAEANLPHGTALAVWARAAETPVADLARAMPGQPPTQGDLDRQALLGLVLNAPAGTVRLDAAAAAQVALTNPGLGAALGAAPFHLQPPLVAVPLASELPFYDGLAAIAGMPGGLFNLLLQRTNGANRRLTGAFLDLIVVATGDGRHSPCLRAVRVYAPRFCYQDEYLPALFHQTVLSDETNDTAPVASAPDFRERLLANFEGMLTPIETRVAAAEYLLDPYAAPAATLPWLASYFGRTLDPGWPEARVRRALANMGRQFRQRGTYRGVCLALDIATDGAVARGEIVLLETWRLRRTDATVLGIPMGGENALTADAVPSGNSIVGETLVLSAERAIDVLALLAPSAVPPGDAAAVSRFLDEYADRVQVAAILQGPSAAAWRATVNTVLRAELPAHLCFDIVLADQRFVLGLSPLLDVDTFLDPPIAPAPLTLGQSVIGRDAVVRDPAALRPW